MLSGVAYENLDVQLNRAVPPLCWRLSAERVALKRRGGAVAEWNQQFAKMGISLSWNHLAQVGEHESPPNSEIHAHLSRTSQLRGRKANQRVTRQGKARWLWVKTNGIPFWDRRIHHPFSSLEPILVVGL